MPPAIYIERPVRNFGHSAAPRQSISPCQFGATLLRIEMAAHDGVDAVRADEHVAAHGLAARPELRVGEMRDDAALVLDEALQLHAGAYRAGTEFGDHVIVDHFLQPTAMDRELREVEAGVRAARFAPDLLAEPADVDAVPWCGCRPRRASARDRAPRAP